MRPLSFANSTRTSRFPSRERESREPRDHHDRLDEFRRLRQPAVRQRSHHREPTLDGEHEARVHRGHAEREREVLGPDEAAVDLSQRRLRGHDVGVRRLHERGKREESDRSEDVLRGQREDETTVRLFQPFAILDEQDDDEDVAH